MGYLWSTFFRIFFAFLQKNDFFIGHERKNSRFLAPQKFTQKYYCFMLKSCQNWILRVTAYFCSFKTSKIRILLTEKPLFKIIDFSFPERKLYEKFFFKVYKIFRILQISDAEWYQTIIAHVTAYLPSYANAQIEYKLAEILIQKKNDFSFVFIWILVGWSIFWKFCQNSQKIGL